MPGLKTFAFEARGVGRKDYSSATEKSVEPVITSYQSKYVYSASTVPVPAGASITIDVAVPLAQVVLLYDVFVSIPSNHLIRLVLQSIDALGIIMTDVDTSEYQKIEKHFLKGDPFFQTIRFILYNYGDVVENDFVFGCSGFYTSLEEFYMTLGIT